jgi:hypothetical protein
MSVEWSRTNKLDLAKFVTSEAANLIKLDVNRSDLIKDEKGRLELVKAIYEVLIKKNIKYALEPFNPLKEGIQLIRTPIEILDAPKEGTCLDLAVLFCSLCLGYELLPYIVIIDGHALAAVSLKFNLRQWNDSSPDRRREKSLFRDKRGQVQPLTDTAELHKLIDSGNYVAVECTGFARSTSQTLSSSFPEGIGRTSEGFLPFERARQAGREQLEQPDRQLIFALDIAIAHYDWKITPPPFHTPAYLWDRNRIQVVRLFRDPFFKSINSIAISNDGQILASGYNTGLIRVWNINAEKEISSFKAHDRAINSIVIALNNIIISGGESGNGKVWQLNLEDTIFPHEKLHTGKWHASAVTFIAMSTDGSVRTLVSGSKAGSVEVKALNLVDNRNVVVKERYSFSTFLGTREAVNSLAISTDGRTLAVSTGTKRVKLWRLGEARETFYKAPEIHDEPISSVAISSDGRTVISAAKNGQIKIWDLTTDSINSCQSEAGVNSIAMVANGQFFVSGNEDGQIEIWDLLQGKKVANLGGHAQPVSSVAVSLDGWVVASSSRDGEIKVWRVQM